MNDQLKTGLENVLGTPLQSCCIDPMTGFYRDGICQTGPQDRGVHVVCAEMTSAFLSTPRLKEMILVRLSLRTISQGSSLATSGVYVRPDGKKRWMTVLLPL